MSNLSIALQLTQESVKTESTRKSNLDYFHEVLFQDTFKSRQEIIAEVNLLKLMESNPDFNLENPEHVEMFKNGLKKSKNMVDTSISNSKNNSSYSFNPKFKEFEIIKNESKQYKIVRKSVENEQTEPTEKPKVTRRRKSTK